MAKHKRNILTEPAKCKYPFVACLAVHELPVPEEAYDALRELGANHFIKTPLQRKGIKMMRIDGYKKDE